MIATRMYLLLGCLAACLLAPVARSQEVLQLQQGPAPAPIGPASSRATGQLELLNNATIVVRALHLRAQGTNDWGADLLGRDVVPVGSRFMLRVPSGTACLHDVRIVWAEGEPQVASINLCQSNRLELIAPPGRAGPPPAAPPPSTSAAGDPSFVAINRSNAVMFSLFVARNGPQDWGMDRLGNAVLGPGSRQQVPIARGDGCVFDLRATFLNAPDEVRRQVNICGAGEIAFGVAAAASAAAPTPPAPAATRTPSTVLINAWRLELFGLHARVPGATDWGPDRLGTTILPPGERFALQLPAEQGCRWEFRAVFRGFYGNQMELGVPATDVCQTPELRVTGPRPGTPMSSGTGFYVSRQGHLVTNSHVIEGCGTVQAVARGRTPIPLRIIGNDRGLDLAVLQAPDTASPALPLRDPAVPLRAGEQASVVGYPLGDALGNELSIGTGGIANTRGVEGGETTFQHNATQNPGNSGGPIFDSAGLVVGVSVSSLREARGVSFGVQGSFLARYLDALGVTYVTGRPTARLEPADVLDRVRLMVVQLRCLA